jgi:hypothetical protein
MRLSDRGRASEAVGNRWSDLCSVFLDEVIASEGSLAVAGENMAVDYAARLDAVPAIALAASRRKLQNPDFLLVGEIGSRNVLVPADAKFSVETAKAAQVSAGMATDLMMIGNVLTGPFPRLADAGGAIDGVFLSPDFSLTHFMLQGRAGHRGRVSVDRNRFVLLPVTTERFAASLDGHELAFVLSDLDHLPVGARDSLLAFLYYFRLARACAGCWLDLTGPLLTWRDPLILDMAAVTTHVSEHLQTHPRSAWDLVRQIDVEAENVRQQRAAVDNATGLPVANSEVRVRIEQAAKAVGKVPPSASKSRRLAGSWFRGQLREQFGPLMPPVTHLPQVLRDLHAAAQDLRPALLEKLEEISRELATEAEENPPGTENGDA